MTRRRRGWRNNVGTSAVEFALVAPILLAFIFLLIEGGRMEWTRQVLQEVAVTSARCMALGTPDCTSDATVQAYARTLALNRGVSLAGAVVATASNQTCAAATGMNRVSISLPYQTIANFFPGGLTTLQSSACFPSVK